jgi:hypothetical protein
MDLIRQAGAPATAVRSWSDEIVVDLPAITSSALVSTAYRAVCIESPAILG